MASHLPKIFESLPTQGAQVGYCKSRGLVVGVGRLMMV